VYGVRSVMPVSDGGAKGEAGSTYKVAEYHIPWIAKFSITVEPMRPSVAVQICRLFLPIDSTSDVDLQSGCREALLGPNPDVRVWYAVTDHLGEAIVDVNVADRSPTSGWESVNQRFLVTPIPHVLLEDCSQAAKEAAMFISPMCIVSKPDSLSPSPTRIADETKAADEVEKKTGDDGEDDIAQGMSEDAVELPPLCSRYSPASEVATVAHRFPQTLVSQIIEAYGFMV
jgi:hypothetical protein